MSESVAGRPVPVIQTKCEVQIDRSNGGIANGPTDPSVSPPSSDSGIHSLGEQWGDRECTLDEYRIDTDN